MGDIDIGKGVPGEYNEIRLLGQREIDYPGKPYERLWKGGATYGFSSYISFVKDGSSAFVLLTNGQYIDNLALPVERLLNELH